MKRYYNQLHNINQELIAQYKVRCNNHEQLLSNLKTINQIIQRAGKLRGERSGWRAPRARMGTVGKPKLAVINACREAIQNGTSDALPKIVRLGVTT
jgi:Bardet-Biedl syndrome 2 protein